MFQQINRLATRRAFSSTIRAKGVHFKEGPYNNIPFKVHDRKVPFAVLFFGFFGVGFLVPLVPSYVQLKKSGVL